MRFILRIVNAARELVESALSLVGHPNRRNGRGTSPVVLTGYRPTVLVPVRVAREAGKEARSSLTQRRTL